MSLNGNRRPSQAAETATKPYSQAKRSWCSFDLVAVLLLQNSMILAITLVAMRAVSR